MDQAEIIKGNKLIAEFMGAIVNKLITAPFYPSELPYWATEIYDFDNLKIGGYEYRTSWDWQIPVWNKFLQRVAERRSKEHLQETEFAKQVDIWENNYHSAIDANSPADAFSILVLAIEWYNESLKTKQLI